MREFLTKITFPMLLALTVLGAAYIGMVTDVPRKTLPPTNRGQKVVTPLERPLPAPPQELRMETVSISQPAKADADVAPLTVWRGSLPAEHADRQGPDGRLVTDQETWRDVWNRLRGTEPPPIVDFTRDVVVLGTLPGSNLATVKVWRDPRGRIRLTIFGTKTSTSGGSYVLARFDRSQVGWTESPKSPMKKSNG